MNYKNELNSYDETQLDYISSLKNMNFKENEIYIQDYINYDNEFEQEKSEEEDEEILPIDQAISIIEDNDEYLILKLMKIFLKKLNEMDFVYSPDFNESGFLNCLITLIGHDNNEISHHSAQIIAKLSVNSKQIIDDLIQNKPLELFFSLLNKEATKKISTINYDEDDELFEDDRSLYFTLITLSVLVYSSDEFRDKFIENKGLRVLFSVVQSHLKDPSIIKEVNRLLFFLTKSVFNEDQVEEDFGLIAEIFSLSINIEPKSAIKFVLNIARMDYFYQVFLQHGIISYFTQYITEGKSYNLLDQILAICSSFANNDPMIFIDALPRLIQFLEAKDQKNQIIYGTCRLLEEILPSFMEYSPEEEEFNDDGELIPPREPLLDKNSISENGNITLIGLVHDSLLLKIGVAIIDKLNTDLSFRSVDPVINVLYLILKHSNPFICDILSSHGLISLLVNILEYDNIYYRSETMHALEYLFDLEIKTTYQTNLISEFVENDGKDIIESFLESNDDDFVQQANSLYTMICTAAPTNY